MSFDFLDLLVVAVYMLGMVGLGVWLGRGQGSAKDYLLGGRDLPWLALLISIVATETSTVTFLSVPGLVYGEGAGGSPGDMRFLQLPIGYLIGRLIAARVLLPQYFQGELFTAYEVLKVRFGPVLRGLASALFLVTRTLADGLRLYLTAKVLQLILAPSLPGLPADAVLWLSVAIVGLSTLVYTFFGGVRAVVWTDVLQFAIYMLGALFAAWLLWDAVGHQLDAILSTQEAGSHLRVFDFGLDLGDPYTIWAGVIGGLFLSLGSHGVDQLIVQRYLCARSQRDAQKALVMSGVVVLLQFAFFLGLGFLLWAFYQAHPPETRFANGDQVFVDYLVRHMPTGVRGLVLGAVFAAAMSTLSGSLNSSASALVNDIILPLRGRDSADGSSFRTARWATLLFGLLQIGVGVSGLGGGSVVGQVLAIASFTTGILLGLFLLARLRGHVPPAAAVVGLCTGVAVTLFLQYALPLLTLGGGPGDTGFHLAWPWFGLVGSAATFLGGLLARSLMRPGVPAP